MRQPAPEEFAVPRATIGQAPRLPPARHRYRAMPSGEAGAVPLVCGAI
jgi:hypothetical protein